MGWKEVIVGTSEKAFDVLEAHLSNAFYFNRNGETAQVAGGENPQVGGHQRC